MKKIIIVTPFYVTDGGGIEVYINRVFSSLAKKGWDITVETKNFHPKVGFIYKAESSEDGYRVRRSGKLGYYFLPFRFAFSQLKSGNVIIDVQNFQFLPGLFFYLLFCLYKLFGFKTNKFIISSHGWWELDKQSVPSKGFELERLFQKTFGVWFINRVVNSVKLVSESERNLMVGDGIKSTLIKIIPNGVDLDSLKSYSPDLVSTSFKEDMKKYGQYFIQLSRIDRQKNLELPISALVHLPQEVTFLIAGDDFDKIYKKELIALAKKLNVHERIKFIGFVEDHNKWYVLKNAFAVVQVSHSEGSSLSILDSMAAGCICIVSNQSSMQEQIMHAKNGFCVPTNRPEVLAEELIKILDPENMPAVREIKLNAQKSMENKGWDATVKAIEHLYQSI